MIGVLQVPALIWRGIGCIVLGLAVLPAAVLPDRYYPRAPRWAKRVKITKSDARWAWRYRSVAAFVGLMLLVVGVAQLVRGLS
jgi:hypothetical protein